MHLRPHKIDLEATKAAGFASRYSYISHRIHTGTEHQCEYLAGQDCEPRRLQVFSRDEFKCVDCGKEITWESGHLAHGGNTKVSRCWCACNLKTKCSDCHLVLDHKRFPQWSKSNGKSETIVAVPEAFMEEI